MAFLPGHQTFRTFTAVLSRIAAFSFRREIRYVHAPVLPYRRWPSWERRNHLASPTPPQISFARVPRFRRLIRSLSLRPSWLLALWADLDKSPAHLELLLPGFQSLGRPKCLPDITTVPYWVLHRRDLHPLAQQLVSLRHVRGESLSERAPG